MAHLAEALAPPDAEGQTSSDDPPEVEPDAAGDEPEEP